MDILVIGGTRFVGRHLVALALDRGHRVTLLNRGRTNPGLFPEADQLVADRAAELTVLVGRRWDVVIDTSGYFPGELARAVACLQSAVRRYLFVSTVSVYDDSDPTGIDERGATLELDPRLLEDDPSQSYGARKRRCELIVERSFAERATIVRPGLIVGPWDYTGRLGYWVDRICWGGVFLAPGDGTQPVQFIDVRDLADFVLKLLERDQHGLFNVVGPATPLSFRSLIELCCAELNPAAQPVWVSDAILQAEPVTPWSELPMWLPADQVPGFLFDASLALSRGLSCRPVAQTLRSIRDWLRSVEQPPGRDAWLSPQKEQRLLQHFRGVVE